jgi:hypothetical protein
MHVDVSESGQGSCHPVQFILKSFSFLLKWVGFMGSNRLGITLLLRTLEPASRLQPTRYLPVSCEQCLV